MKIAQSATLALLLTHCGARTGLLVPEDASTPADADICALQPAWVNDAYTQVVRDTRGRHSVVVTGTSVALATGYDLMRRDDCPSPMSGMGVHTETFRRIDSRPQPPGGVDGPIIFIDSDVVAGGAYCYTIRPQPNYGCPSFLFILYESIPRD